jgi:hypothetical protein
VRADHGAPRVVPMRDVTCDEYLAYIAGFPARTSYRTGICEPPEEHCVDHGVLIGRITYYDLAPLKGEPNLRVYQIRDETVP